jgi:hypothetical protein
MVSHIMKFVWSDEVSFEQRLKLWLSIQRVLKLSVGNHVADLKHTFPIRRIKLDDRGIQLSGLN